ncbi:substrate-binding domain-containing protein [Nocardioides cynanchi]|uniref:substrate-binding domain-containing protein n=1 Tax=Nocardioides cynanchi TaxID=2558918 RepID=UPI0017828F83|nr:substrate-binding domain-containing protein [Nocardioides cynanchi]
MSRRTLRAGLAAGAATLLTLTGVAAHADPNPTDPGTPISGKSQTELYAAVGADAFAELTNNVVSAYDAQAPAPAHLLESYDAVNPVTGQTPETITTKPGCPISRPNGANGGLSAILLNQKSTVDNTSYCIDWVRSSRAKKTDGTEAGLTFYAQSQDAVSYAVVGNAYAPTTPLTTAQLKDIFECTDTDWSQVGGQAGPIHVYLPPASAATLTFFLQAIGTTLNNVQAGCQGLPTVFSQQQNDGRTMNGDPMGIAPYAVTKWAAQSNQAPGIADNRGGTHIGLVNTTTSPITTTVLNNVTYDVLNPAFTTGDSTAFGRLFFNAVRNDAPQDLKDVFKAGGFLCQNQDAFLVPFGNTPLGNDQNAARFCGQAS